MPVLDLDFYYLFLKFQLACSRKWNDSERLKANAAAANNSIKAWLLSREAQCYCGKNENGNKNVIICANLLYWTSRVNNLAHCLKHLKNYNLNKCHCEFSFSSAIMLNRPPDWDWTMFSAPFFFFFIVWAETHPMLYQLLLRKQAKTRWPQQWVDKVWMEDISQQSPGVWTDSDELELAAVIKRAGLEWVTVARRGCLYLCTHSVSPRARNCLSKSNLLTEQSMWAGVDQYALILFKRQKSWGKNYIS